MLACTHPAFDGPVILFQDVIEILHRSMSTLLFQNSAGFELNDGWRISSVWNLSGIEAGGVGWKSFHPIEPAVLRKPMRCRRRFGTFQTPLSKG